MNRSMSLGDLETTIEALVKDIIYLPHDSVSQRFTKKQIPSSQVFGM
jgi:hypothetical protein